MAEAESKAKFLNKICRSRLDKLSLKSDKLSRFSLLERRPKVGLGGLLAGNKTLIFGTALLPILADFGA